MRVYQTSNLWIKGPCCNINTRKVFLTHSFVETIPEFEVLGGISHEFGHIVNANRFKLEFCRAREEKDPESKNKTENVEPW
jgi:hypothetical protein